MAGVTGTATERLSSERPVPECFNSETTPHRDDGFARAFIPASVCGSED